MTDYRARAVREGKWWVIEVEGVGTTQARSTTEAQEMALDLVHAMTEEPVSQIEVDLSFHLSDEIDAQVRQAREDAVAAERAQTAAAERLRAALRRILAEGVTKRDAARILKVSPQRISQLTR